MPKTSNPDLRSARSRADLIPASPPTVAPSVTAPDWSSSLLRRMFEEMRQREGGGESVMTRPELIRRLASRLLCASCTSDATTPGESASLVCAKCGGQLVQRSDDNEATVRDRLAVYRAKTMPLLDFYKARPTFRLISGSATPDCVAEELARVVDSALGAGAGR